jgi:hypothetical protein
MATTLLPIITLVGQEKPATKMLASPELASRMFPIATSPVWQQTSAPPFDPSLNDAEAHRAFCGAIDAELLSTILLTDITRSIAADS